MKKPQKTVNIRIREKAKDKLKIRAIKEKKTLMDLFDDLARLSPVK